VNHSGSGKVKLSLFKKTPPRQERNASLPGGARPSPPGGRRGSRLGFGSSGAGSRARGDTDSALSRSCVMSPPAPVARTGSRDSGRPGTGDSMGRMSIRISRQPSTYGALHDMVETKKLGGGVIRGLVGEEQ